MPGHARDTKDCTKAGTGGIECGGGAFLTVTDSGEKGVVTVRGQCELTDMSCGPRGEYPEDGLVLYCYAAHHGTRFAGGAQEVSFPRGGGTFRFSLGPIRARVSGDGLRGWGGLRLDPPGAREASVCFALFAHTRVRDPERPSVAFQTEGDQKVPLGFGEVRVSEAIRRGRSRPISVPLRDPSDRGVVKGALRVVSMSVEGSAAAGDGGEDRGAGPWPLGLSAAVAPVTDQFFRTFRERLHPSDPSVARFQVPFYDAGAGRIPSGFFAVPAALVTRELERDPVARRAAEEHLSACLSAALGLSNLSEEAFASAVEEQMADASGRKPPPAFFACLKAGVEACCLVAHRVRYTPDHTTAPAGSPWAPVAFKKVERFLDCLVTMAGDCEDVARLALVYAYAARGAVAGLSASPALRAWWKLSRLFVPAVCVCSASAECMGKGGGGSEDSVCHVVACQVPRWGFAEALSSAPTAKRLARERAPGGGAWPWPGGEAFGPPRMPWEAHLTTCVMEGTMPTTPLQLPLAEYGVSRQGREAHAREEDRRRLLERSRGEWGQGTNPFSLLDVEVQQDRLSRFERASDVPPGSFSEFYRTIVHVWCPGLGSCDWFGGACVPFLDLAACVPGAPPEFGVPFGRFVCMRPGETLLEPSYVVDRACASASVSVLGEEMPVRFPPAPPAALGAGASPPHWELSLEGLAADFAEGVPPSDPSEPLVRSYTSYRLDPGEVTDDLVKSLRWVLSSRLHGYRGFRYRVFCLAEGVTLVELRMYSEI